MIKIMRYAKKITYLGGVILLLIIAVLPLSFLLKPSLDKDLDYAALTRVITMGLGTFCDSDVVRVTAKEQAAVVTKFEQALDAFQQSSDYGELALQNVIELLALELKLVRLLFHESGGASLESAVAHRNRRLHYSIPSVTFLYDTIINLATYDYALNKVMIQKYGSRNLDKLLDKKERNIFLMHMEQKLEYYQKVLSTLQYTLATSKAPRTDKDRRVLSSKNMVMMHEAS